MINIDARDEFFKNVQNLVIEYFKNQKSIKDKEKEIDAVKSPSDKPSQKVTLADAYLWREYNENINWLKKERQKQENKKEETLKRLRDELKDVVSEGEERVITLDKVMAGQLVEIKIAKNKPYSEVTLKIDLVENE